MGRSRDLYKVALLVALTLAVIVVIAGMATDNIGFFFLGLTLLALLVASHLAWRKLHTTEENHHTALDKAVNEVLALGKLNLERSDDIAARVTNSERMLAEVNFKLNTLPKLAYEVREIRRGMAQMPFDVVELAALRGLMVGDQNVPVWLGGGQASIPLVDAVRAIMDSPHPPNVVELGSGQSTAWFALALANRGDGRLVTFEHDALVYSRTQYKLERLGLARQVHLTHAPLVTSNGADVFDWYDVESQLPDAIDVLFVDGPPLTVGGQLGRYPVLPQLERRLRVGSLIILDDAALDGDVVHKWRAVPGVEFAAPVRVGSATVLRCTGISAKAGTRRLQEISRDEMTDTNPGLRSQRSMWLGNAYECRQFGA